VRRTSPTLAATFDARRNSLNILRLTLAGLVMVAHAWPLGGFGGPPGIHGVEPGGFAVAGFFVISGYLITGSRVTTGWRSYAWRRARRIFPGYWGALAVTAFAIAPASALLSEGTWKPGSAARYVLADLTTWTFQPGIAWTIPGVPFQNQPQPLAPWNGSAWTLPWELACYAGIGLLIGVMPARLRPPAVAASFGTASIAVFAKPHLDTLTYQTWLPLAAAFLGGAVLRMYAHRIPCSGRVAAGAGAVLVVLLAVGQFHALAPLPLAYLVLWTSIRLPLPALAHRNDYSYGVYIYGFPVQQLLAGGGAHRFGLPAYLGISFVLVVPLAMASWHLIERPATRWRGTLPRTARPDHEVSVRRSASFRRRTTRAGLPATTECAGTSLTTTDPAPTMLP
jgi:peptidoglycan/LPS O-acetylase OafA/YrhL